MLLGVFACENEPVDNGDQNKLIGTWFKNQRANARTFDKTGSDISNGTLASWNYETVVTTNSDQNAKDLFSEGIGGIDVSEKDDATLTYMFVFEGENGETDEKMINAFLTNFSFISDEIQFPFYGLSLGEQEWIDSTGATGPVDYNASLYVQTDDSTYTMYNGNVDFSYDGKSLTVMESTLIEYEGDKAITIKGDLAHSFIAVPANTPTVINTFGEDNVGIDQGGWTIDIREDGKWVELYQWDEWSDSTVASWEVDDDILKVTYDFSEKGDIDPQSNDDPYPYIIEFSYKIENNELLLTNEYNICDDNFAEFCLTFFEYIYGFDPGSLESIVDRTSMTFTQTPSSSSKMLASEPTEKARRKMLKEINAFLSQRQQ